MPTYTYRREDGTTFDIRQSFHDDPLAVDPKTGQKVTRVIHNAGVIFKGSGFYVTDTRGASRTAPAGENGASKNGKSDSPSTGTASSASAQASSSSTTSSAPSAAAD